MSVEDTLKQRNNVHGNYARSAGVKDKVLEEFSKTDNWKKLGAEGRQTVRMIVEKLGRVMYGDCFFPDHWHDIAGYATLMEGVCLNRPVHGQTELPLKFHEEGVS